MRLRSEVEEVPRLRQTDDSMSMTPCTRRNDAARHAAVWATPCVPVGYLGVPPVGSGVWVEFEGGDTDYPIWSGCWLGERGTVSVEPGGIELSNGMGASLRLTGPTVSVNDGALDVT